MGTKLSWKNNRGCPISRAFLREMWEGSLTLAGPRRNYGLLRRNAVWIIPLRPRSRRHKTLQQRIVGRNHPAVQAIAHLLGGLLMNRIMDQISVLSRIKEQIVQTLLIQNLGTPARTHPQVFAGAVIAVG